MTVPALSQDAIGTLTLQDVTGLVHMREEEKLARDVYSALAAKWGARPFGNIVRAEQAHMDQMKTLLVHYGVKDPVGDQKPGRFTDLKFSELYKMFVKRGEGSRSDALKVGAEIEELDIADLGKFRAQTTRKDILTAYEFLDQGSRNHLRAFMRNLNRMGETYAPKYLDKKLFDSIVSGTDMPQ